MAARKRASGPPAVPPAPPPVPEPPASEPAVPPDRGTLLGCGQFLLPLAFGAALLASVIVGGNWLREQRRQEPDVCNFADIECDPPPGMTREEFLGEVQFLADLPDRFDPRDEDDTRQVRKALASHPWVSEAGPLVVDPGGRVRAELAYRKPVLALSRPLRAADAAGTLLPASAVRKELPVLVSEHRPPAGRPGESWGDPDVLAAAAVADLLGPHLNRLGLAGGEVRVTNGDVIVSGPGIRLVWGSPPGREKEQEAKAAVKLQRLSAITGGEKEEWDLRRP